jgi:hypothetical protein
LISAAHFMAVCGETCAGVVIRSPVKNGAAIVKQLEMMQYISWKKRAPIRVVVMQFNRPETGLRHSKRNSLFLD